MVWKLFARIKSVILESYCFMDKIITGFPLSVCAIMASLSLSFVFMLLIVFAPRCMLCVLGVLFNFRVFMHSAVSFLYTSWSEGEECYCSFSFQGQVCIQFFGLLCNLYLGPFCSGANSYSENAMAVLFMTLG